MTKSYWLVKSEPEAFSIDHLAGSFHSGAFADANEQMVFMYNHYIPAFEGYFLLISIAW